MVQIVNQSLPKNGRLFCIFVAIFVNNVHNFVCHVLYNVSNCRMCNGVYFANTLHGSDIFEVDYVL